VTVVNVSAVFRLSQRRCVNYRLPVVDPSGNFSCKLNEKLFLWLSNLLLYAYACEIWSLKKSTLSDCSVDVALNDSFTKVAGKSQVIAILALFWVRHNGCIMYSHFLREW